MIKTINRAMPMIDPVKDGYIIMLEDLEFAITRKQLRKITDLHNRGMSLTGIAKEVQRDVYEVVLALLHQARTNRVYLRPFKWR